MGTKTHTPQEQSAQNRASVAQFPLGPLERTAELEAIRDLTKLKGLGAELEFGKGYKLSFDAKIPEALRTELRFEVLRSTAVSPDDVNRFSATDLKEAISSSILKENPTRIVHAGALRFDTSPEGGLRLEHRLHDHEPETLRIPPNLPPSERRKLISDFLYARSGKIHGAEKEVAEAVQAVKHTVLPLDGPESIVKFDTRYPVAAGSIDALKRYIGNGCLQLLVGNVAEVPQYIHLFREELDRLKQGALFVKGPINEVSILGRSSIARRHNGGLKEFCDATTTGSRYEQSYDALTTDSSASISVTCNNNQHTAKVAGPVSYKLPFVGLTEPQFQGMLFHEPFAPTDRKRKIYAPSGRTTLSEPEKRTAEQMLNGTHDLEKLFRLPKGRLGDHVTVIPDSATGPHVIAFDSKAIRVTEDQMLRVSNDQARNVGRHEGGHQLDRRLLITERPSSAITAIWNSLNALPEATRKPIFEFVNESSMYLITNAGHSQDAPTELFASLINSVLHPRIEDIIRRASSEFVARYDSLLEALGKDLTTVGFAEDIPFQKILRRVKALTEARLASEPTKAT